MAVIDYPARGVAEVSENFGDQVAGDSDGVPFLARGQRSNRSSRGKQGVVHLRVTTFSGLIGARAGAWLMSERGAKRVVRQLR